ncbi:hypothetical protein GCM10020295_78750 [Streptomyces cinereospinus]
MLSTTLRTLRTRWVTFAGSFVALSLGVALIAVMGLALASSLDAPERGPERFAAAPVVVKGQDTLVVSTSIGDRTQKLAQPRAVPDGTVAKLRDLGTVVEDRSFAVRAEDGPADLVGHPWSTAAFAPYRLDAGRAPEAADEIVVSGDWARPGTRVRTGDGTMRVVGTVTGLGFENAVFYTDARAAELSPRSLQLVVDADAAAVREAVRGSVGVQVLTADARRYADADPDRDSEALTAMNAMFGTAGGVTGFVSVFVVASTFAFAVAQRRREFGLLRTAGATPGQLRRMVVAEALAVGVAASAAGCVLASCGAPALAEWAAGERLAPRWFTIGDYTWPYHLAFWTGLLVALCGVLAASWRAGRTGPTEALCEASVETRPMTPGRRLCGAALLITAAVTLALALVTNPGDLLHRKTYVGRPMLLISAAALLAPALVRPLARLIAWLPARLPGAGGCWSGRTPPPGRAAPPPSRRRCWSRSRWRARCSGPPPPSARRRPPRCASGRPPTSWSLRRATPASTRRRCGGSGPCPGPRCRRARRAPCTSWRTAWRSSGPVPGPPSRDRSRRRPGCRSPPGR